MPRTPLRAHPRLLALIVALPVASLAATLAVILRRIPVFVDSVQNSDSVGPMLIAETVGRIPHGSAVTMASEYNFSIVGLDVLTRWVPGHRTLWLAFPVLLELGAIAILAATVRSLAGWRGAVLCAAIAIATPPVMLAPLLSQAFHNTAFFLLVVTGTFVTWQARTQRPLGRWRLVAGVVLGFFGGVELLSDHLYFLGLLGMVGAAALLARRLRDRQTRDLLVATGTTAVIALVVFGIGALWAAHAHVHSGSQSKLPATPAIIEKNLSLLRDIVLTMVNARGASPGPLLLRIVCAAAALAGLLLVLWTFARLALTLRKPTPRSDDAEQAPLQRATTVFAFYWAAVSTLLLIAFVFSRIPIDLAAIRYMAPVLWAVAALVPLVAATSWLRTAVASTAVAVVGLYGVTVLAAATPGTFQPSQGAQLLADTLAALHVDHGYAGYWQGDMLTWQSDGRVVSRSVWQRPSCGAGEQGWFCPYTVNSIASWYAPSGRGPSFLVVDHPSHYLPWPLPPELKPARVLHVDRFLVYVFDEDIGAAAAARTMGWSSAPG